MSSLELHRCFLLFVLALLGSLSDVGFLDDEHASLHPFRVAWGLEFCNAEGVSWRRMLGKPS